MPLAKIREERARLLRDDDDDRVLATAACAVVLTAYPASLLLFESGLLAPLAVPLGYIGVGFFPMALWMRKAERW